MQLVIEKISTPTVLPQISRPRLLHKLNVSLASCNLTIIKGRAGTGKTFLASDFARRCGRSVAWYKVDASDSDPAIFFQYLIASIERQRPGFCQGWAKEELKTATLADMSRLAESFIYELLEHPGNPLLIVIDDFHLICDEEWVVPFFSRVGPLLPSEAHLIIIGRILPPAPLWRMRSKQTLCVIDESSLAFTLDETKRLLDNYRLTETSALEVFRESRGYASKLSDLARARIAGCNSNVTGRQPYQLFL